MLLLLRGGTLIDPVTGQDGAIDILVKDGVIEQMGTSLRAPSAQIMEMKGNVIAPGFIDMHVHLREPGYEHKETIASGCAAAAAGGFAAVCCMPNTNPAIDDESVIRFIQSRAAMAMNGLVDVHPVGAVTVGRKGEHLASLGELAEAGAVAFSDDGDPVADAEIMRRALEYAAMYGRPIIQHAQDIPLTRGGAMNEGYVSTALGLTGMPSIAEEIVVARDLRLVAYTGGRYHAAHVSTGATVELIRAARARGLQASCEVTPHHLTLTEEAVRTFDTNTKMNPPLRTREDVEALKEGLRDGTIEVIATDHAPHSFDEKEVEYQAAPFGIIGLETAIGLAVTELVRKNVIQLYQLVEKLSTNPRRILGLPQIAIEAGHKASLTIFNPTAEWVVHPPSMKSMSKNTPFGGMRLTGRPVGVINNAQMYWLG